MSKNRINKVSHGWEGDDMLLVKVALGLILKTGNLILKQGYNKFFLLALLWKL